jgi:hypothetical protein
MKLQGLKKIAGASATVLLLGAQGLLAQEIAYISSASGYMLHQSGNIAVTAAWNGQRPITGFSGYGQININGSCLTGRTGGQPLTWERCSRGDRAQVWGYSNGRLNNELGWCADVEGNRAGANVRILAWQCSNAVNQRWKRHDLVSRSNAVNGIRDPNLRTAVDNFIATSQPGQMMPLTGAQASQLPSNLIGLDGASLISAGGLGLISAGGLGLIARSRN